MAEENESKVVDAGLINKDKTDWQEERAKLFQKLAEKDSMLHQIEKDKEEVRVMEEKKKAEEQGKLQEYNDSISEQNKVLQAKIEKYEQAELDKVQEVYAKLPETSQAKLDLLKESLPLDKYRQMVELEAKSVEAKSKVESKDNIDYSHIVGSQGMSGRSSKTELDQQEEMLRRDYYDHFGEEMVFLPELKKENSSVSGSRFTLPIRKFIGKINKWEGIRLSKENDPYNK